MNLIVETGSGVINANSFTSLAYADQYVATFMTAADRTLWGGKSDDQKDDCLRQGTLYLQRVYHQRWKERRTYLNQALDWPRTFILDADGFAIASDKVPVQVQNATVIMAVRSGAEDVLPDIAQPGTVLSESVSLGNGAVSTSTTYATGKSQIKLYRAVELEIGQFLRSGTVLERG